MVYVRSILAIELHVFGIFVVYIISIILDDDLKEENVFFFDLFSMGSGVLGAQIVFVYITYVVKGVSKVAVNFYLPMKRQYVGCGQYVESKDNRAVRIFLSSR